MSKPIPDPEVDFEGFVKGTLDEVIKNIPPNAGPEFWVERSAVRLKRFVDKKFPDFIIENEKRILLRRIAALPVYCDEYDELTKDWPKGEPPSEEPRK